MKHPPRHPGRKADRAPPRAGPGERAAAARTLRAGPARFAIVGIGASAGGLEDLNELFAAMPADTGMAFVVVTHQVPGYVSLVPEIPAKQPRVPVATAADGARLEPNRVYVGRSGVLLGISSPTASCRTCSAGCRTITRCARGFPVAPPARNPTPWPCCCATAPPACTGVPLLDIGGGEWNHSELRRLMEEVLPKATDGVDFKREHNYPRIAFVVNARRLERETGVPRMIPLALGDATGRPPTPTQ